MFQRETMNVSVREFVLGLLLVKKSFSKNLLSKPVLSMSKQRQELVFSKSTLKTSKTWLKDHQMGAAQLHIVKIKRYSWS